MFLLMTKQETSDTVWAQRDKKSIPAGAEY